MIDIAKNLSLMYVSMKLAITAAIATMFIIINKMENLASPSKSATS
jgi:hypothetical protein